MAEGLHFQSCDWRSISIGFTPRHTWMSDCPGLDPSSAFPYLPWNIKGRDPWPRKRVRGIPVIGQTCLYSHEHDGKTAFVHSNDLRQLSECDSSGKIVVAPLNGLLEHCLLSGCELGSAHAGPRGEHCCNATSRQRVLYQADQIS